MHQYAKCQRVVVVLTFEGGRTPEHVSISEPSDAHDVAVEAKFTLLLVHIASAHVFVWVFNGQGSASFRTLRAENRHYPNYKPDSLCVHPRIGKNVLTSSRYGEVVRMFCRLRGFVFEHFFAPSLSRATKLLEPVWFCTAVPFFRGGFARCAARDRLERHDNVCIEAGESGISSMLVLSHLGPPPPPCWFCACPLLRLPPLPTPCLRLSPDPPVG